MPDIIHRVGIKSSSLDDVYKALTSRKGLAAWWTNNTQGESNKVGGVLQFRFEAGGFDMKVLELHPAKSVLWQVVDGPKEWMDTKISWELKKDGNFITLGRKPQPFKAGDEALPGARRSCLAEEVCGMLWPWTIGRERIQSTD